MRRRDIIKFVGREFINYYMQNLSLWARYPICKPSYFSLRLTYRCNLRCGHCTFWRRGLNDEKKELNTDQWKKIIQDIKEWSKNAHLIFGGGEPLLREDLFELLSLGDANGCVTSINTNGAVSTRIAKKLAKSPVHFIKVSIDGWAETHDYSRGKGSFKKILKFIEIQEEHKKNLIVTTIINNFNLESLPNLIGFVKKEGIRAIEFQPLFPDSESYIEDTDIRWYKKNKLWPKNHNQTDKIIKKIISLKRKNFPVNNSVLHLNLLRQYYNNPNQVFTKYSCMASYKRFTITPYGEFFLCGKIMGNVNTQSLGKLWNSPHINNFRRVLKNCKKGCMLSNCDYRDTFSDKIQKFNHMFKQDMFS